MHLAHSVAVLTIGSLFAAADGSAQERSASNSQRYRIHVPSEVKFGRAQLPAAVAEAEQAASERTDSLVFMAETTTGLTIQFDTDSEPLRKVPLTLKVGSDSQGAWHSRRAYDMNGSSHQPIVEATSVQASTLNAGRTTLQIDIAKPPDAADATMTTIVITIVGH